MNLAPRMPILAESLVLQILSVYLQRYVDILLQKYVKCHLGGTMGQVKNK